MPIVKNYTPSSPSTPRIAIVGEAPGATEEEVGKPFQGASGQLLRTTLSQCGLSAEHCFIGNVCQFRPPQNDIKKFDWRGAEIQHGLKQLYKDLHAFQPDVVFTVGATAVRALFNGYPPSACNDKGEFSITKYRGSPYRDHTNSFWCVASFHPSYLLRSFNSTFYFLFDVKKAIRIANDSKFHLPNRRILYKPNAGECVDFLTDLRKTRNLVSFDIEGGVETAGIKCVSFCNRSDEILTVPLRNGARYINGNYFSNTDQEVQVWQAISALLSDPSVPKLAHNLYYELFVMLWNHGIVIRNLCEDTMFMQWELMAELDKDLGTVASIYTDEPYYKTERKIDDDDSHRIYCAKDSAVTLESFNAMRPILQAHKPSYEHYRFNIKTVLPYLYMQVRGCRIDQRAWTDHFKQTFAAVTHEQAELNKQVGAALNPKSTDQKLAWLYGHLKEPPQKLTDSYRLAAYLASISPRFTEQKKRDANGTRLTADEAAIDKLYVSTDDRRLLQLLKVIQLRTRFSDIQKITPLEDGRIRCSFTNVGPITGRSASSESVIYTAKEKATVSLGKEGLLKLIVKPTKFYHGTNLQNQTKDLRNCFIADPGNDFFQYDLAGADAWTVAADLKALGFPQMFNHLKQGIKPSKNVILAMRYGLGVVKSWKDADWKAHQHEVDGDDIMYLCSKRVQHGTNYGMEVGTLIATILKDSIKEMVVKGKGKPIRLSAIEAKKLQQLYLTLYCGGQRRKWIVERLKDKGYLDCANGTRRKFFSIRNRNHIDSTVTREALCNEPQANTTYVTNMAACNMFYDFENRRANGSLKVEPLQTIHDALTGQWPQEIREWALPKLREWFNITITIHGIEVTIPADGGWGTSWKDLTNEI